MSPHAAEMLALADLAPHELILADLPAAVLHAWFEDSAGDADGLDVLEAWTAAP